jgi:uroporphyrinogen decarboxylase
VPPENLEAVAEIVHDVYARDVARALLEKQREIRVEMDLTDYGKADRIVVDVITLDSEACAPCQYMVEAVKAVLPHFGTLVVVREHKIKEKESVEFMMAMMVKNVPTICIDGKIKFISLIPTQEELIAAIQERINEKFNLRLRQKKNRILVLGAGCDRCLQTLENVQKARKELGSTVEVVHISNEQEIYRFGVISTPAVVVSREQVKCTGRVPSVEVIKEWLKDLA